MCLLSLFNKREESENIFSYNCSSIDGNNNKDSNVNQLDEETIVSRSLLKLAEKDKSHSLKVLILSENVKILSVRSGAVPCSQPAFWRWLAGLGGLNVSMFYYRHQPDNISVIHLTSNSELYTNIEYYIFKNKL